MLRRSLLGFILACVVALAPLPARAGIPVIDVAAVANLIQQITYWQQQLQGMVNQLNQLHAQYAAITGGRGMEGLLPMTNMARNYLPPDYAQLMDTINGASMTYAGLSGQIQSAMAANAVLTNAQLAGMTPQMRQLIEQSRRAAAMAGTMSQSAYQNTSQRFAALQQLINSIGAAGDAKAIADLQGRINAEQAMLTNEQTKLQTLYQMAQADQWTQGQRVREQVVSGHGSFGARYTPTPR